MIQGQASFNYVQVRIRKESENGNMKMFALAVIGLFLFPYILPSEKY
jgi:hypothetical protein